MLNAEQKIIFTGPVGAGKTTAIATISGIPVVRTEARATDETARLKPNTTVAMDYGVLNLDGGLKVHLYGTPGQQRFNFMWEILTQKGIGLVLLVDNRRDDPLEDMRTYLEAFRDFISDRAVVIGVTGMDIKKRPGLYSYHTRLAEMGMKPPLFEVDARRREDVKMLLLALLAMLDPGLQR
jgi:signal recognition particle receptor subunit beta